MDHAPSPKDSREGSKEAPQPRRRIAPALLIEQVRNTAPFLFAPINGSPSAAQASPYGKTLLEAEARIRENREAEFSEPEYYRLSISAHWATVGTFVPTDVDNAIRFKLWDPLLPTETIAEMARIVLESKDWDPRPVTTRWVSSPESGERMSGHDGEWFSIAAGAYGALRRRDPELAARITHAVLEEVRREARIYDEFRRARDGLGLLRTACLAAHNLGDLDRVIDLWNLPAEDPLRQEVYKSGHPSERPSELFGGSAPLAQAGNLNKAHMAAENHRHFALRAPRALRRSADLLLPLGPFFDDWGRIVGKHPALRPEEVGEVVDALVIGWEKLPGTVGYARALAGILESFPGGFNRLTDYIPARVARDLKGGKLRALISVPKAKFEEQWATLALNFVKANPLH